MWLIVSIILIVICLILLVLLLSMKAQARGIGRELEQTRESSYNKQITIPLVDRDMEQLAAEINRNLDYQKSLKLESEQSKQQLQQSISDIAHDLRTPLTVIKGNLQMLELESGEALNERSREHLRVSKNRTDALREMVDDFFEMSVLESDANAAELSRMDVTAMLTQFVIDHEALIREYGLTPKLELPEKSIFVTADEKMLLRMFGNLLNNILKYAQDSFTVSLIELSEAGTCRITFSNAVKPEEPIDVDRLFERTYRGDKARPAGGAGLGLYIVQLLAEKQGIQAEARLEDRQLCVDLLFIGKYIQQG